MISKYELMVILKPLLPEDIRSAIQKRIEKLVKDCKGKITATDVWGKKHLAYPIKRHEEGYYIIYKLEADSNLTQKLQNELKLINDLLRFLLIKLGK